MTQIIYYSPDELKTHILNYQVYHCILAINGIQIAVYATKIGIFKAHIVQDQKQQKTLTALPMPPELSQKLITGTYPLIVTGTLFQQSVWREITNIKPGSTITYSQLAQNCGNKNAVRAAANAAGKNPAAYFIPCHRVIGKNGHMRGYKWGIAAKKLLLEHETKNASIEYIALA